MQKKDAFVIMGNVRGVAQLVARRVRDAEVVSSNLVASTKDTLPLLRGWVSFNL